MAVELDVVCVRWGTLYGREYVTNLKSMVERHLGIEHRFRCITDDPFDEYCEPLACEYPGWWAKVGLFKPGVLTRPTLYLDLDVVIVSSLDWVRRYLSNDFAAAIDWGAPLGQGPKTRDEIAGCLIVTNGEGATDIFTEFSMADAQRLEPHGDQTWMTEVMRGRVTEVAFGRVMSYKRHCVGRHGPPVGSSVIAFHGRPNPHEVGEQWVVDSWR